MSRPKRDAITETILRTALDKFIEKGFFPTTIQEIADEASIAAGTIYNYFENKEALYEQAISFGWDQVIDTLKKTAVPGGTARQNIENLITISMKTIRHQHRSMLTMLGASVRRPGLIREKLEKIIDLVESMIAKDPLQPPMNTQQRRMYLQIMILGVIWTLDLEHERPINELIGTLEHTFMALAAFTPVKEENDK